MVLLHSTDLYVLTNMAPIAKSLMEKAGLKVDMQSMDWQTLVSRRARRDPPDKGGWNVLITSTSGVDSLDPLTYSFIGASCDKAWFGWPCDEEITKLRHAFADEPDEAKRKEIVEKIQLRAAEVPTHAFLGQYNGAMRSARTSRAASPRRSRSSGTSRRSDRENGRGEHGGRTLRHRGLTFLSGAFGLSVNMARSRDA